ncbi:hypothetical protein M8C21_006417 [Ambrosia artemisiifolia]|uniref:Uncharacterized protein n=1 Tax=Ambrosia artemisiifolia TaxID=4212 RepID=A0AAD5BZW5_AMBAR|nr:hypothetical protein M8C21_006417 [Ambrosia artemisiifolia]
MLFVFRQPTTALPAEVVDEDDYRRQWQTKMITGRQWQTRNTALPTGTYIYAHYRKQEVIFGVVFIIGSAHKVCGRKGITG